MRLFATAFALTLKHSGRWLLCLLALALPVSAGVPALSRAAGPAEALSVRAAIVLEDRNPLARMTVSALVGPEYRALLGLELLDRQPGDPEDYTAVLTLPDGFFNSVLTGRNLSPTLRLNVSSPVEALCARQMALSASRMLGAAQRGVTGALGQLDVLSMPPARQDELILGLNLALFDAFLDRRADLEAETLSAFGALSLGRYYAVAALSMLALGLAFLHQPAAVMLRRFARQARRPVPVLAAFFCVVFLLTAALLLPCVLLLGGPAAVAAPSFWLAAALVASFALLLCSAFSSASGCAALSIGLSAAMGLLCGGFVPPALMPPALLAAGDPLPLARCVSLLSAALTGGPAVPLPVLLWCAALSALALPFWLRSPGERSRAGGAGERAAPAAPPPARPAGGFFATALALAIKERLRSRAFLACALFFVGLIVLFAAIYPQPAPLSLSVGLLVDTGDAAASEAAALLEQNADFVFERYAPGQRDALRRDLLAGRLHCAYLLDSAADRAITAWGTDASALRPVTDELVMTAWFEAGMADMVEGFLTARGLLDCSAVRPAMAAFEGGGPAIDIRTAGRAAPVSDEGLGVAPLLYAVLIAAFLLCALLCELLAPAGGRRVTALLCAAAPRVRQAARLAPVAATVLLYAGVLLLAEGALVLFGPPLDYSPLARLILPLALALPAALLSLAAGRMAARPLPLLIVLPVWTLFSVLLSGAVVDPALLGAAGWLKVLSPAFWLLRLMTALS